MGLRFRRHGDAPRTPGCMAQTTETPADAALPDQQDDADPPGAIAVTSPANGAGDVVDQAVGGARPTNTPPGRHPRRPALRPRQRSVLLRLGGRHGAELLYCVGDLKRWPRGRSAPPPARPASTDRSQPGRRPRTGTGLVRPTRSPVLENSWFTRHRTEEEHRTLTQKNDAPTTNSRMPGLVRSSSNSEPSLCQARAAAQERLMPYPLPARPGSLAAAPHRRCGPGRWALEAGGQGAHGRGGYGLALPRWRSSGAVGRGVEGSTSYMRGSWNRGRL